MLGSMYLVRDGPASPGASQQRSLPPSASARLLGLCECQ